jgi:hypothetical protein
VAWANSVWQKAVAADPSQGGLGLTDDKLQKELRTQVDAAVTKAQEEKSRAFIGREQALPADPRARLSTLTKRLRIEQTANVDTKVTTQMIAETQRQIVDMENRARQSVLEAQANRRIGQGDQRIQISIDRAARGSGGGGANADLGSRAQAIENQAMGAPDLKAALRIVERANLPRRDRTEVRQDVMDQFREPAPHDTSGLSNKGNDDLKRDMITWSTGGMDPNTQPNPDDPKYQKKTEALHLGVRGGGGGGRSTGGGGGATKRTVSLRAAMALPNNKGKPEAQVRADIEAHGYTVAP